MEQPENHRFQFPIDWHSIFKDLLPGRLSWKWKKRQGVRLHFLDIAEMVSIFDWADFGVKRRGISWASIYNHPQFDLSFFRPAKIQKPKKSPCQMHVKFKI